MLIHSIFGELKISKELLCVEKPPVAIVVIECAAASNPDIPDIKYNIEHNKVNKV